MIRKFRIQGRKLRDHVIQNISDKANRNGGHQHSTFDHEFLLIFRPGQSFQKAFKHVILQNNLGGNAVLFCIMIDPPLEAHTL